MPLQLFVLGSGSKGNALLLQTQNTRVLVDCGLPIRALLQTMETVGVRPSRLDAILLTHEHVDHTRGLPPLLSRSKIPLYGSEGTLTRVAPYLPEGIELNFIKRGIKVGPLEVETIDIPHDAAEPVAFHISVGSHRLTVATDLGEVPEALQTALQHSSCIVLESNHDEHLLDTGLYPEHLKVRIRSNSGHLSNRQTAAALAKCKGNGLRHVILAHLSENNNDPSLARSASEEALEGTQVKIHLTAQGSVGPFINIAPAEN